MTKALVTGAAGFIGSHVVRELLDENVEVRALLRPGEGQDNLAGLDVEIQEGDLLDRDAIDLAMQGVDQLFHLAAIYAIWLEDWSRIYEVNLQGSRNVLWAALRHDVERVVYTSSIAALGTLPGRALANEETPFNQYALGHHYLITKYVSQQEALSFADNDLDLVVVNPAFPFGDRDSVPTPTGQLIVDILRGHNRFYFPGGINLVDVRDVARGHVLAMKKGQTGRCYILGNQNVTLKEFVHRVARMAGLRAHFVPLPVGLTRLAAHGFKWYADHVSKRSPLATPSDVAYSAEYLWFDNRRATQELGLDFTPVDDSLDRAIRWFREHGYVR